MAAEDSLNPKALSERQIAKALGVPPEWIEEDVRAGAPTNADGTLNLVHYTAWLNKTMQEEPNG